MAVSVFVGNQGQHLKQCCLTDSPAAPPGDHIRDPTARGSPQTRGHLILPGEKDKNLDDVYLVRREGRKSHV